MLQQQHKASIFNVSAHNFFCLNLLYDHSDAIPTHISQANDKKDNPISLQSTLFPIHHPIHSRFPHIQSEIFRPHYAINRSDIINLSQEYTTNPMRCTFNQTKITPFWLEDSHEESIFQNITHQTSHLRLHKFKWNKRIIANINPWNYSQRVLYVEFLRQFFAFFEMSREQKRKYSIYARMEEFIRSRNYAQCRIRHGSMIRRYKTIQNIIKQQERRLRQVEPSLELEEDGNRDVAQLVSVEVDLKGQEEKAKWAFVEEECWSYEENTRK